MKIIFPLLFCTLCLMISGKALGEAIELKYDAEVFWDSLSDDSVDPDQINVYLNGNNLGQPARAFQALADAPLTKGQRVKISLQLRREDGTRIRLPYARSHFIQIWLEKGVSIDLFEKGKKLNVHTITFAKFWNKKDFISNLDDAVWYGDGEVIGNGASMVSKLEQWASEGNVVIQEIIPLGFIDYNPLMIVGGSVYQKLFDLTRQGKIWRIAVEPDGEISQRYLREVIMK